ncbi:protein phosphatase Slingshot homolog 1 isoform X2 [Salmo salar]|uniref:protein-serine/threonine phosphatase n=1 Tax=Salmo salar TaxID=8030 RepID=A0A1S3L3K4_SALSA|nr:protein phosphatase Slingshot homolog 1-like isoform X2 [Salmo salar]XP_013985124.1 protein phosphatase Slingshot homolog 1-like isoform X2 [Salmo salar]|eukprot:XP_013985123.1 PREDICTED: protein phosphatase Slingshot homolog 1-like isoform X2 [Salmo salar]
MALVTVQRSPTPSTSSSPCVSESGSGEDDRRSQPRSISESFLTVKGAALFLPRGNGSSPTSASRFAQLRSKHAGDLQQHLQTMFTLLRPEDNIKLAVRLESSLYQGTRYMVVVSTNGRQDTEESLVLGMDFSPADSSCSVGLVLPLWSDSLIHLDGDGGFSVSTDNRIHVFKPVSVQAMWSALQSLHKACEVARCHNYFPGSLFLTWVSYYQSRVSSDQSRINEWNAMQDVQSHRADSPVMFSDVPTERERTERLIKTRLREIMMHKDLENVTCKEIRTELEVHMVCNLCEFKEYIDNEMILILGQMDSPTEIFDHVYLGSEWNASNLEELQNSGVQYILNVTREIDNFFPGVFEYHNIRVYDEEATDLLAYWNDTYKFISRARKAGAKCLVHCKMGVSRSASTVIAYAMKEYGWDLERAFNFVKERRAVTKPNPSFMRQLEEYQGILLASKQRHNKLWRSHSDSDLSEHHEPLCKTVQHPHTLGRSHPRNQGNSPAAPSLQELLQPLGSPSNTGQVVRSISECGTPSSAGKVVQSSSQPNTTATQENNLDTNQETRTEALLTSTTGDRSLGTGDRSLGTGDQNPSTAATIGSTGSQAQGESVCSQSPPLSNGLCDYEEDPSTPLPQPRAATVVPNISTVTVAETVPVGRPHSPPIHHLLVSPATLPTPSDEDETPKAKEPSTTLPKEKYCQLQVTPSVPESSSMTPETSTQTAGPQEPSTPVPDKKLDCDQRLPGASLGSSALQQPSSIEVLIISQPSAPPQDPALEAEGSSALSTDHINFFSAREKFQGLTQDGRTRCLSDQALQQTPQPIPRDPGQEQQEDPSAVATGEEEEVEERKRESIVSVHLIVTELESMTHTVAPPPGPPSQPEPTASQDHEVGQSNQEVEGKDAESQQEVEVVKEEVKDEAEEMEAVSHSPPAPHSADWAMGSVRRVTQQLEQRMRQDSPSPPPPSLPPTHPHRRSPLFPHSREHSPPASHPFPETNSNPQNAPRCLQGSEVSTVQEKDGGCSPMEEDGGQEAWREGLHEDSVQMHKHNLSDGSLASTLHPTLITPLYPTLNSVIDPLSSVDFLCLEGVTEFESGTDWDSLPGRGLPGDDIMRETWETLRELGAFLRQVSGGGAKVPRCVGQVWGEGTQARQKRVRGGDRQRAREVEARIRQAGLTPPSLMKRSASLAKLGCLELSANDLSNWDISPTSLATPAVEPLLPSTAADESSRKLRVLFHNALCPSVSTSRQESLTNRAERPCESGHTPSEHLHSPTSNQGWQKGKRRDSGHAPSLTPDLISVATRQQYGRTHPLRRLKKRTVSTLYHTM